uniref:Uncharacterized protein n=1 Tax=Megaselia scalaris TaxID=36166 RepID=T1GUA2_MEGSC
MSCISSNFSSFFLDSLNDPSEFAKYLSNGDNRMVPIVTSTSYDDYNGGQSFHHQNHHHLQNHHPHHHNGTNGVCDSSEMSGTGATSSYNLPPTSYNHQSSTSVTPTNATNAPDKQQAAHPTPQTVIAATAAGATSSQNSQHFDGSFEFLKYLRYSADYGGGEDSVHSIQSNTTNSSLIDLDSTPSSTHKSKGRNGNLELDSTYDHDSKHNIFDLHHQTNSCSSTNNTPHLSASNSNPSSECGSDNSNNLINHNSSSTTTTSSSTTAAAA